VYVPVPVAEFSGIVHHYRVPPACARMTETLKKI